MRSYGGSVIGARGIQGIKNVDSALSLCCINTALACPHRDRAPERRHAQRYRSWNQPRSTKRKTCRSKFSLWWQCHLFISARQRIKPSMHAWDEIMLRCTLDSRFTDLELLQLGLLVQ